MLHKTIIQHKVNLFVSLHADTKVSRNVECTVDWTWLPSVYPPSPLLNLPAQGFSFSQSNKCSLCQPCHCFTDDSLWRHVWTCNSLIHLVMGSLDLSTLRVCDVAVWIQDSHINGIITYANAVTILIICCGGCWSLASLVVISPIDCCDVHVTLPAHISLIHQFWFPLLRKNHSSSSSWNSAIWTKSSRLNMK